MHFWIDKRATSFPYGRRRPTFYSSGTFASSSFGRERGSFRGIQQPSNFSPASTNSRRSSTSTIGDDQLAVRNSPRLYYQSNNERRVGGSRRFNGGSSRNYTRPATYPPIQDPSVQEALDELQQELQASLLASSSRRQASNHESSRKFCLTTKHVGLTLCFLGFILLCTVVGKFVVEGPGVIDSSRSASSPSSTSIVNNNAYSLHSSNNNIYQTQQHRTPSSTLIKPSSAEKSRSSVSFFFVSEIIFVAFALGLFLTGVSCLRKRTNEYLQRQFREHIINSHHHQDDGNHNIESGGESSRSSGTTLLSVSDIEDPGANPLETTATFSSDLSPTLEANFISPGRRSHYHHRYLFDLDMGTPGGTSGRHRRYFNGHQLFHHKQKPPPYDVAIYLPLPNQQAPSQLLNHEQSSNPHVTLNIDDTNQNAYPHKKSKTVDEKEESNNETDASITSTVGNLRSRSETPPPAYELQFSYEI